VPQNWKFVLGKRTSVTTNIFEEAVNNFIGELKDFRAIGIAHARLFAVSR